MGHHHYRDKQDLYFFGVLLTLVFVLVLILCLGGLGLFGLIPRGQIESLEVKLDFLFFKKFAATAVLDTQAQKELNNNSNPLR